MTSGVDIDTVLRIGRSPGRTTRRSVRYRLLNLLGRTIAQEMLNRHLNEQGPGDNGNTRSVEGALRFGKDFPTLDSEDARGDVQGLPNGYGFAEIHFQTCCHHRVPDQPVQCSEHLVYGRGEHTPVGQSGRPLMVFGDREVTKNAEPRLCRDAHMETGLMIDTASEAPPVVRRYDRTGDRGIRWAFRHNRVIRWSGRICPHAAGPYSPIGHTGVVVLRERLLPPLWLMGLVLILPSMLAIAYGSVFGAVVGIVILVTGVVLLLLFVHVTSPVVHVHEDGSLSVGQATLPRSAMGGTAVLTSAQARQALNADARFFVMLRPWYSKQVLRVDVTDPDDPHVGWLVSVRRPDSFQLALASA